LGGTVAVVTGASRGIGRQIALSLGQAGARVVPVARSGKALAAVARQVTACGGQAFPVVTDITSEAKVGRLFARVKKKYGHLDILVNNAGVGFFGPLADMSVQDFDRTMEVNVRGTFLCCREAMRLMIPRKSGTIINIASVVGFRGYPNQSAYTASKHAVMGLTKSLAVEAQKHGIRVSAILPGGVDTDMVRASRPDLDPVELMHPADIAQAVLYLLSLSERAAVDQIYIRRCNSAPF